MVHPSRRALGEVTQRTHVAVRTVAALLVWLVLARAAGAASLTVTVLDAAGKPLADAVVIAMVKGAKAAAASGASAQIAQKDRQFVPQVSVVQAGTSVQFPNLDTTRHHVYSFSPIRKFELKLYSGTPAAPVLFDKAGIAVLGCNIHDRMRAWVVVVDTPHFAKTDANGQAVLDVPAGEHLVRAWHRTLPDELPWAEQLVQVGAADAQARVVITGTEGT